MKILFVCTGNTCRSPMAQGLAQKIASDRNMQIEALSAGLKAIPGSKVSDFSVGAMKEYNIDISSHIPTQLELNLLDEADLVVTMTKAHKEIIIKSAPQFNDKVRSFSDFTFSGDIADPYGCDFNTYKKCSSQINDAIVKLYERIEANEGYNI